MTSLLTSRSGKFDTNLFNVGKRGQSFSSVSTSIGLPIPVGTVRDSSRAGFIVVGAPVQHGGGVSIFFEFYLNVLNAKQLHDVIGDHRRDVMELLEYQR